MSRKNPAPVHNKCSWGAKTPENIAIALRLAAFYDKYCDNGMASKYFKSYPKKFIIKGEPVTVQMPAGYSPYIGEKDDNDKPILRKRDAGVWERHFFGDQENLIGTFFLDENNMVRRAVIDIDGHDTHQDPHGELKKLRETADEIGLPYALSYSKSGQGFHIEIFFFVPIENYKAAALLQALIVIAKIDPKTEVFPKQDEEQVNTKFGNLTARAGSAAWNHKTGGSCYLDPKIWDLTPLPWAQWVDHLEGLEKLTAERVLELGTKLKEIGAKDGIDPFDPSHRPKSKRKHRSTGGTLDTLPEGGYVDDVPPIIPDKDSPLYSANIENARAWLAKQGPAISGSRGNDHTFNVAGTLAVNFALSDQEALSLLLEWNVTCQPPWEEHELIQILYNGRKYSSNRRRGSMVGGRRVKFQKNKKPEPTAREFISLERALDPPSYISSRVIVDSFDKTSGAAPVDPPPPVSLFVPEAPMREPGADEDEEAKVKAEKKPPYIGVKWQTQKAMRTWAVDNKIEGFNSQWHAKNGDFWNDREGKVRARAQRLADGAFAGFMKCTACGQLRLVQKSECGDKKVTPRFCEKHGLCPSCAKYLAGFYRRWAEDKWHEEKYCIIERTEEDMLFEPFHKLKHARKVLQRVMKPKKRGAARGHRWFMGVNRNAAILKEDAYWELRENRGISEDRCAPFKLFDESMTCYLMTKKEALDYLFGDKEYLASPNGRGLVGKPGLWSEPALIYEQMQYDLERLVFGQSSTQDEYDDNEDQHDILCKRLTRFPYVDAWHEQRTHCSDRAKEFFTLPSKAQIQAMRKLAAAEKNPGRDPALCSNDCKCKFDNGYLLWLGRNVGKIPDNIVEPYKKKQYLDKLHDFVLIESCKPGVTLQSIGKKDAMIRERPTSFKDKKTGKTMYQFKPAHMVC